MTVLKVEIADIAFAVDSILAAVALAVTLPIIPNWEKSEECMQGISLSFLLVVLLA